MAKPKPPSQKTPSQKTIKSFFKLISLDLAPKVASQLASGFDPNVTFDANNYGAQTPLMYALDRQKHACVRVLLDANADVTATGPGGGVLHEVRDAGIAKELIERGASVHVKDQHGRTPLHVACANKQLEIVALLLEHGAVVDEPDNEGKTPYASASNVEIRALLKRHGAKGFGGGGGKIITPTISKTTWKDVELDRGTIGVARNGCVWFGSYSGLVCFDGVELTRHVFAESFAYDSIAAGPGDVLYISTNWGLLQLQDGEFRLFSSDNSELFDNHLVYMRTNASGHPYLLAYESGSEEKHITIFDGTSFSVLSPGKDFPTGLEASCLAFDAAGALVIGSRNGLAVQRDGVWTVITEFGERSFPPHIYDLAFDGGTMWIGTQDGVYTYRDRKFTKHSTPTLAKRLCIAGDSVWIGMYYGGLGRLRKTGELTVMKQADSVLPHDDVEDVVCAPDGAIWIHAGRDVARIRNEQLERLSGEPPEPPAKPKARKLQAFPKKPLVARAKVPKPVVDEIQKAKLESVPPDRLLDLIRPAIAFDCVKYKTVGVGESKFGGQPDLPPKLKWPTYSGDSDRLLPFVLQWNLADVHPHDKEGLLPAKGMLYFFSDTSPDDLEDARILYSELPPAKLVRRPYPEDLVDRAKQTDFIAQVPEYKVELFSVFTLPSPEILRAYAELSDEDDEALRELGGKLVKLANKKLPGQCSRLLGWPDSIQEEVTNSVDQIALLQLNGYELSPKGIEKIFAHWCSDGLIHVVIKAEALARQKFDKASASMAYT
jgi:hypothetical protein